MNKILRLIRNHKVIVSILLGAAGVICITGWRDNSVVSGVGISLLASAVTSIFTSIFLGDDEYPETARWGLEHIYPTRGEMNSSCDEYMKKAKYIKVMAFGLRSFRDSQESQIRRILEKGGYIKIITMDPDCRNLKEREKDEKQLISNTITDLLKWAKKINQENYPGKVEIRLHDHLPHDFMFLMNNRLFTGPYEYGKGSQQTVSFEYSASGEAFEYYEELFDKLWNDPDYCHAAFSDSPN